MGGSRFDVIVCGGGPGGAAAAWKAASLGASVAVLDKATFPRPKACGDGVTPRGVALLRDMGLGDDVDGFHRARQIKVVSDQRTVVRPWPDREGLPSYCCVVSRVVLDNLLLEHAAAAGAHVEQGVEIVRPVLENGTVTGVVANRSGSRQRVFGGVTIAADGMSSRVSRSVGLAPPRGSLFAVALRAEVGSHRPDDSSLEVHFTLRHGGNLLPGYGWVFPMGGGRLNVGVGYMSTYKNYRAIRSQQLMSQFVGSLPVDWRVPPVAEMIRTGAIDGWRIPMGLTTWPPWRGGIMAVGDAVGAAKPFTGAGISKAIQSGLLAGEVAAKVKGGDPSDLSAYERGLRATWRPYYRVGRGLAAIIGRPAAMAMLIRGAMRASAAQEFLGTLASGNGDFRRQGTSSERASYALVRAAEALPGEDDDAMDHFAEYVDTAQRLQRLRSQRPR